MLLQVTIPDGLYPGDPMTIAVGNDEFTIIVPDGVACGEVLDVDLPLAGETAAMETAPSTVLVVVPDGCFEGDEFIVALEGREFSIGVPAGCGPGIEIEVEVPAPEESAKSRKARDMVDSTPFVDSTPTTASLRTDAASLSSYELIGMRAMLVGLISNGLLNGKKGTVVSYDTEKDLLKLSVDHMHPYMAVRREHLFPLPWEEEPDLSNDEEPIEAPPAGVHYVGDRVNVERSNGRTSLATIVEYDEVFEAYVVDVGNGVLKYGVEESYMTPYETSNEWVGPATRVCGRWEGFFVGRRVRVPTRLPSSHDDYDDDRNATVNAYDVKKGQYWIETDLGARRPVPIGEIRVPYKMRNGVMA